jgi:hypothetical protein
MQQVVLNLPRKEPARKERTGRNETKNNFANGKSYYPWI